jgi:non-ribosomal peptide synthetase component F
VAQELQHCWTVSTVAIHRLVEEHAATRGGVAAIVDRDRALSYRELNHAANAVARRLMARGFRRGAHACVRMPRSAELAVVLLAVLKGGGCYTWSDPARGESECPPGLSLRPVPPQPRCAAVGPAGQSGAVPATGTTGERHLSLDVTAAIDDRTQASPNLPVVSRGSDTACVLQDGDGAPVVLVPHATIAALRSRAVTHPTSWRGDAGAFDLWMALMAGTTAVVEAPVVRVVAA